MAPAKISADALQSALSPLRDVAEVAATLANQEAAERGSDVRLQPVAVSSASSEQLRTELGRGATAFPLRWGADTQERLLYLCGELLGGEESLALLRANARHFLSGSAQAFEGELEGEGPEVSDTLRPEWLPPDPLIRLNYLLVHSAQEVPVSMVLSASVLGGLLQRQQESEVGAQQAETEAMEKERKIEVSPPNFEPLAEESAERTPRNLDALYDLALTISVELGRTEMTVGQILELGKGSIIELDKMAGDPVDLYVNGRKFAEGDVVVVEDRFGVRITSLAGRTERLRSLGGGS